MVVQAALRLYADGKPFVKQTSVSGEARKLGKKIRETAKESCERCTSQVTLWFLKHHHPKLKWNDFCLRSPGVLRKPKVMCK